MNVRRAVPGDEPLLRSLRLAALRDAPDDFGSTLEREEARTEADWRRWIEGGVVFFAENAGSEDGVSGLVAGVQNRDHALEAFLVAMWVRPEDRGGGAADPLVQSVVRWAGERGYHRVLLHVFDENPRARRVYERNGFRRTGGYLARPDGKTEIEMAQTLPKGKVILSDADPAWAEQFAALRDTLAATLGDTAEAIEHVGSTSVPGLAAKPILDVDVIVATPADVATATEKLATLGYEARGTLGVPDRHAYYAPAGAVRQHLYVCPRESLALRNHLAVRDYLRAHPEAVEKYAATKRELAERHAEDIDSYVEGKSAVLREVLAASGFDLAELDAIEALNRAPATAAADTAGAAEDDGEFRLRAVRESDLDAFFAHQQDEKSQWEAAFVGKDPADRAAFDAHWAKIRAADSIPIRTIEKAGRPVGHVLSYLFEDRREVSYWLDRAATGRGLATAALRAYLTEITERPIFARVAVDNRASVRVLEKCGFTVQATERGFANARGAEIEEYVMCLAEESA